MAKILITLVGTGRYAKGDDTKNRYEKTDYILDGELYKDLTFTSNALIEHFDIEKVFYIGTSGSMWDNIAEYFGDEELALDLLEKKDNKTLKELDLKDLNNLIDSKLNSNGSKCFIVEIGENEDELWSIFEKFLAILDKIKKDDIVYFDITHLFRPHSVMSFIIAEFGKISQDINIGGVFYGMLKKNEASPLINIGIFFELLEWIKAIDEMERFGSLERLVKLSNGKINKNGYNALVNMHQAFDMANMSAIHNSINKLKNHLRYFSENDNKIIRLIAPKIENFIKALSKNTLSEFQFALAEFFANKNYHSLAYIALAEAIITKICETKGLNEKDKEDRENAKNILYNFKEYPYNTQERKFWNIYFPQINRIRNNIAHQLETTKQSKDDINNFEKYIKESKRYLKTIF